MVQAGETPPTRVSPKSLTARFDTVHPHRMADRPCQTAVYPLWHNALRSWEVREGCVRNRHRYFVDLFAGCGGLSLGLEQAGFTPILVNELNGDALESYLLNRDRQFPLLRKKYHIRDIKELVLKDGLIEDLENGFKADYGIDIKNGELDLVVGGPPCQGFSGIGHRRSFSVDRIQLPSNFLYEDMAYVISRLRPKIFLFENVQGLLSSRWTKQGSKGEVWQDVLDAFSTIPDYVIGWQLVSAKEYGVAQNRPRVLLVGVRSDMPVASRLRGAHGDAIHAGFLPEPDGSPPDLVDLLDDLVDPEYRPGGTTRAYPSDPKTELQAWLRTDPVSGRVMLKGEPVTEQEYSNHSERIIRKFMIMHANGGIIPEEFKTKKFAQRVWPARWGSKGPTITATSLADDYVHYSQPRVPTVREWARLQMFPDWYQFAGSRTTGGQRRAGNPHKGIHDRDLPKYTQIGNAVPVRLAYAVGLHFRRLIEHA